MDPEPAIPAPEQPPANGLASGQMLPSPIEVSVQQQQLDYHSVAQNSEEGDSQSQPPGFRRSYPVGAGKLINLHKVAFKSNSSSSNRSSTLLKKRFHVDVVDIFDVMSQYFELGTLLGYDMNGNKERVRQILSSVGVIQVDQRIVFL